MGQTAGPGEANTQPHQVPSLTGVRDLEAAGDHTCAINDQGVWCWGGNQSGQLGYKPAEMCEPEPGDDPVAGEDAGDRVSHVVASADGQPVPTPLPARLDVVAPVRLRVDLLESIRPVVAAHVGHPEVGVELGDELRELHTSMLEPTAGHVECGS